MSYTFKMLFSFNLIEVDGLVVGARYQDLTQLEMFWKIWEYEPARKSFNIHLDFWILKLFKIIYKTK